MAPISRVSFAVAVVALVFAAVFPAVQAQAASPAPTSDGKNSPFIDSPIVLSFSIAALDFGSLYDLLV